MTRGVPLPGQGGDLRLPPERFFWAVLDTSSVPSTRGARRREQLSYMFESVVPIPLEDLHVELVTLGPDRVLACGAKCSLLDNADRSAATLGPASLPDWLIEDGVDIGPQALNLLTGPHEPLRIRKARLRLAIQVAAILVVITSVAGLGMYKRVRVANDAQRDASQLIESAYVDAVGPSAVGGQPPAARLTAELRRLRQTRSPEATLAESTDAAPLLASMLGRWPDDIEAQTEQITISGTSVRLVVRLPDTGDAERLTEALIRDGRWRTVGEQSVERTPDGVRVRVSLEPVGSPES